MNEFPHPLHQTNQSLKSEFTWRGLDLSRIWQPTPEDPALENQQLVYLLVWVEKYESCRDRQQMEADGYDFPPIQPGIDPDSDWLRFERWMNGQPVRETLATQLPETIHMPDPDSFSDREIEAILEQLTAATAETGFSIDLQPGLPPRLAYIILQGVFGETFEYLAGGCWHIDGCSGYCPECVQRPWCETGQELCWEEDAAAGKMVFPDVVRQYVSPVPDLMALLRLAKQL